MNRQAKSAIKSLVLTLRHKLEEDIAIGLKRYGFAGERWLPIERLPHIERDDAAAADHFRLRASLEQHLRRIGATPEKAAPAQRAEAVDWFVREVAFTHLNRLVALKCLEARGLIPEIITTRDAYGGRARAHYEYRFDHPAEAAAPDDALPAAIRHVCRIVYPEFRLLFDVGDPATGRKPPADDIVWPATPVLRECIALINGLDETANGKSQIANGKSQIADSNTEYAPRNTSLWLEDEIIGWIYQFYNAEQKEAIRDRGAPQRPAEVAVINQFFTPRWIVKFLVDNTLGRLWLEMHPDSPRVRAKCDYLVPEPANQRISESANSGPSEQTHGTRNTQYELDPDSPINNPKAPPRRKAKRPEEIRLIDPACGAMHFGHYAFEVFQAIYQDYYELYADDANPQHAVRNTEYAPRTTQHEIAPAILRHNLYGVDIDLRAAQLAALSLFIKAKHALSGVEGTADPNAHITQMNLVVADAVLPTDGVRTQFLDRYKDDKAVQDAVRQVLDEMANVAEVGSLLRVEERLRAILEKAGHAAATDDGRPTTDDQRRKTQYATRNTQLTLADLPEAQPEDWGAHYTVARLLDDLREFAARALQTHDLNAQLFAEEAEKSVHLLDVFLNDYDVVVMNPPYNKPKEMLSRAQRYMQINYKYGSGDLYAAFFERAYDLLASGGYCGALTSRTFLFLAGFEEFRRQFLIPRTQLRAVADLGFGILDDAAVETCATVIEREIGQPTRKPWTTFLRLLDAEDRPWLLEEICRGGAIPDQNRHVFAVPQEDFNLTPRCSLAYWVSHSLLLTFSSYESLKESIADVRMGLSTADDERFLRYHWEVTQSIIAPRWVPHAKGGEFSRYYQDLSLVVDWHDNGQTLAKNGQAVIRNASYYFKEGLTYPHDTVKGLNVRLLPSGATFGAKGPGIFMRDQTHLWFVLGYLNSTLAQELMLLMTPSRSWEVGLMQQLPCRMPAHPQEGVMSAHSRHLYETKLAWDTGNETCTRFDAPWLVQARRGALLAGTKDERPTTDDRSLTADLDLPNLPIYQSTNSPIYQSTNLPALLDYLLTVEHAADARLQQLQAEIDGAVYDLYDITAEDRALIERELGDRPREVVWPQMAGKPDDEKRREHVRRLVSWCVLNALKEKRDGILPVTPVAGEVSAVDAVRRGLEAEFGEAAAFRMESEIGQVLGQPLADWLDGPFIKWHTPLYKRRPVVWHLASPKNAFGCLVHLHKLDADTLRKVQTLYLWPRRRGIEAERDEARRAVTAGDRAASRRLEAAEALLDDLAEFEKRLLSVIQAQVKCEIPDWAEGPFRDGVYDPVLDDGVKVNITPLQEAGVLRYGKVV